MENGFQVAFYGTARACRGVRGSSHGQPKQRCLGRPARCYSRRMVRRLVACLALVATALAGTATAQAPSKHFLWSVTADGTPPTYLLGSLHVLTPDYYPLSRRIDEAFARPQVLIGEIDMDEMSDPATVLGLLGKALLEDGRTLDEVISPELYARVVERAAEAGLPRAAIERMKPWMVALSLTMPALQAAGFEPEHGIDRHFFERAKRAGMERRALETVAFQFARLDQMSEADQEALLRSTLDDLDAQIANVKTIADAWARGDTEAVEKLLLSGMAASPALYKRLLVERNASWVSAVETCLEEQTSCFVVVGAAHLVGPDSLVALLRKKGYVVEQQ